MIVVDCEMSGVDPLRHGIIAIGAVDLKNPANQFSVDCRLDADHEIALIPPAPDMLPVPELVGMSEEEMRDPAKLSIKEALEKFFVWVSSCDDQVMVAQNWLDIVFIEVAARKYDLKNPFRHRFVDLHSLAVAFFLFHGLEVPIRNGSSDLGARTVANFVGIPEEPHPHEALTGAKYEAETFSRLVWGKSLLPEFAKFPIPEKLKKLI